MQLSIAFPDYWDEPFDKVRQVAVKKSSPEFTKLETLLNKTMGDTVKVTNIERIQHPILWQQYFIRRGIIVDKSSVEKIPGKVLTTLLREDCNEYYLFHGCNASVVEKIAADGFDERLSSLKGLFGSGIYFAENSEKSSMYTHSSKCAQVGAVYGAGESKCTCRGTSDEKKMFITRVVLGSAWVRLVATDSSNPLRRPPAKPKGEGLYDSVMGQSKNHDKQAQLKFREFIIYDRQQCYPEYIITFCS